jgi:hypothetical protein
MDHPFALHGLAAPALALSFWLLQIAHAPRSAFMQQALAIAVGVILLAVSRVWRVDTSRVPWIVFGLAFSLWLPIAMFSEPDGPERWLNFGGIRLYLAPVVAPLMLFWLGAHPGMPSLFYMGIVATTAIALTLQPDAAQLTAFASAMLTAFLNSGVRRWLGASLSALLIVCLVVAWRIPDPLAPVPYVEGVFGIAAEASPLALLAALAFAAMPVAGFVWVARDHRCTGAFPVAAYYVTLFALAPLQITPVPLVGFGAGPILGYFLVTSAQRWITRESTPSAESVHDSPNG